MCVCPTVHSSSRPGESPPGTPPPSRIPWDQAPPPPSRHPRNQAPPSGPDPPQLPAWLCAWTRSPSISPLAVGHGPDPPQFPPWVWAWTRSPSTSPLGVGLETPPEICCKACWDTTCNAGIAPPSLRGQTHTCKHITLPKTSFAGGNKYRLITKFISLESEIDN